METTERIVEAYVRYVKNWATIPNIRCEGQFEIDLFAIDPVKGKRYHIESGVSVSGAHSKLTAKPFSTEDLKKRVKQAGQRRTLDYFVERKFGHPSVMQKLEDYGCRKGNYTKIIVTWGWQDGVELQAKRENIKLWDFRNLIRQIALRLKEKKSYFTDDTIRTLHLFALAGGSYDL